MHYPNKCFTVRFVAQSINTTNRGIQDEIYKRFFSYITNSFHGICIFFYSAMSFCPLQLSNLYESKPNSRKAATSPKK